MSCENRDRCRLCSSPKNLLSMFSGKSKAIRDYLRKMIADTVHIKIEQQDSVPSVCFNCSVDICNFYFFKLHCQRNEEQYKILHDSPLKTKKLKLHVSMLKDIESPDMQNTESVLNWLCSKRINLIEMNISKNSSFKDTERIDTRCDKSIQCSTMTETRESQTIESKEYCDRSTQSNMVKMVSQKSQTERFNKTKTKSKGCQASSVSEKFSTILRKDEFVQTESMLNVKDGCCQSESKGVVDNYTQTEESKFIIEHFHNSLITTDISVKDPDQKHSVPFHNHPVPFGMNGFQSGLISSKNIKCSNSKEPINSLKIAEPHTFSDALLNDIDIFVSKLSQTESNSTLKKTTTDSLFEQSKSPSLYSNKSEQSTKISTCDKKSVKEAFEQPPIIIQQMPVNHFLMSPQSSELLQIIDSKSGYVKICRLCDQALYSKKEVMMHKKTHMQCNLCRKKFRSLKATEIHIKDCKEKQIYSSPVVALVKLDDDLVLREKYSIIKQFET